MSVSQPSIALTGIDALNPLGFLAALGLLRILDANAETARGHRPWLSFSDEGQITPILGTLLPRDAIVEVVLEDAARQAAANPILNLAYDDDGALVAGDAPHANRDLKPPRDLAPTVVQAWADADRRTADLAGAMFSELVSDNNGNTKPTAFHFTAGQQAFLQMVNELRQALTADHLREAISGPWLNASTLPSLGWDSSVARLYALRARDPSGEKRGSVPGANWLAFQALAFFPVVVQRNRLVTTCVSGGWKDGVFTWPVWTTKLSCSTVASLLRLDLRRLTTRERAAAGVHALFASKILRSDQGGYGSFSPAAIVLPNSERG